jgi:membrane-associated phospholipid phosphatase
MKDELMKIRNVNPQILSTNALKAPSWFGFAAFFFMALASCSKNSGSGYLQPESSANIAPDPALKWTDMSLYTFRFSSFNSPTYTSRSMGYLGLAMYEAVVNGDPSHISLNNQLNGLSLPQADKNKTYNWVISLNAAEDTLLKLLYPVPDNSHRYVHEKIDSLANAIYDEFAKMTDPGILKSSVQFGQDIALAIYAWSVTDGGDKGFNRNFDPNYIFPTGPSYWVPPVRGQTVSQYPLHPYWGENRSFVAANGNIPIPPIEHFSTDTASNYYKMYRAIYDKDPLLTKDEREIAAWWADDPTESFSPPGHSYYLASLAIKKLRPSLVIAAEAYARTGIAVADAFINCWKVKVKYFNERPSSYVKRYIDPSWIQFWPEPPFPAFPSGHSNQAAAGATVLTDLFGDNFAFTDDSHEGHRRYDDPRFLDLVYPARNYQSFWAAANECGYSRLLGGIHTKQDNETGLKEGQQVGNNVNALHWSN